MQTTAFPRAAGEGGSASAAQGWGEGARGPAGEAAPRCCLLPRAAPQRQGLGSAQGSDVGRAGINAGEGSAHRELGSKEQSAQGTPKITHDPHAGQGGCSCRPSHTRRGRRGRAAVAGATQRTRQKHQENQLPDSSCGSPGIPAAPADLSAPGKCSGTAAVPGASHLRGPGMLHTRHCPEAAQGGQGSDSCPVPSAPAHPPALRGRAGSWLPALSSRRLLKAAQAETSSSEHRHSKRGIRIPRPSSARFPS